MYYVTMTDNFMSGWGRASGLINKLIFLCDTLEEARIVEANAKGRSDMKRVSASGSKPGYYRKTKGKDYQCGNCYVQIKTKDDYPSWYKPGTWK